MVTQQTGFLRVTEEVLLFSYNQRVKICNFPSFLKNDFLRNIDENIPPVLQSSPSQTTICQGTVSVTDTALQPAGTTWILPAAIAVRNHRKLTHVNQA